MIRHVLCAALVAVSGCTATEVSTRGVTAAAYMPAVTLAGVTVAVPRNLEVSESNNLYPMADIVWRGDGPGDRFRQVEAVFTDAAREASASLSRGPEVTAHIEVVRFHSLTETARAYTGGDHDMQFLLTVTEMATGRTLLDRKPVHAVLDAHGGRRAIAAEQRGEGMRVRIVRHLAGVLRHQMSVPVTGLSPDAQVSATLGHRL